MPLISFDDIDINHFATTPWPSLRRDTDAAIIEVRHWCAIIFVLPISHYYSRPLLIIPFRLLPFRYFILLLHIALTWCRDNYVRCHFRYLMPFSIILFSAIFRLIFHYAIIIFTLHAHIDYARCHSLAFRAIFITFIFSPAGMRAAATPYMLTWYFAMIFHAFAITFSMHFRPLHCHYAIHTFSLTFHWLFIITRFHYWPLYIIDTIFDYYAILPIIAFADTLI